MLVPSVWDPRSEAGRALLAASWALPEENMDLPCLELSGPAKSPAGPSPGERSSGEAAGLGLQQGGGQEAKPAIGMWEQESTGSDDDFP